jgi:transposase
VRDVRDVRELNRYRRTVLEERSREAQRLDKVLQDAGIKLSSVASDVLGVSARRMLDALVAGTTDPDVLTELAKGLLRKKLPALCEALSARFSKRHAVFVAEILAPLDFLEKSVERLSGAIDEAMSAFADARDRLSTIPGVDSRLAEALIGEIGVDMSRFPTASHLASWAGMCPGQHESAGKSRKGTSRDGNSWVQRHLTMSAMAASRTKGTYLSSQYHRLAVRRGSAVPAKRSATPSSSRRGTSSMSRA